MRWKLHVVRGVLAVFVLGAFVYAIRVLSLADAYSIYLSAPLIITALSVPVLGERVGWHRWAAIGVGLLRRAGDAAIPRLRASITLGALAALISAIAYAIERRQCARAAEDGLELERRVLVAAHHDAHQHGARVADLGADPAPSTLDGSSVPARPAHWPSSC